MAPNVEQSSPAVESEATLSWRQLCPWFLIFRAIPVACSPTIIFFALIAAVLTPAGWYVAEKAFLIDESDNPLVTRELQINRSPYQAIYPREPDGMSAISVLGYELQGVERVFFYFAAPAAELLRIDLGWRRFAYYALGSIWMILVWSFFATAISRVAMMRLTRNETIGIDDAFGYALWKLRSTFFAVMLPVIGVFILAIPLAIGGLLLKFGVGTIIAGLFWFLALLLGLLIMLLLVGLLLCWPLIAPSVAAEGQDSFDALSRTFAYAYRRPLHYLLYVIVTLIVGGVVWLFIGEFSNGVIHATHWAASFGSDLGGDRMEIIQAERIEDVVDQPAGTLVAGRSIIRFWNAFVHTIAAAFMHGFFWSSTCAIYLLLRKDMDLIDYSEVVIVEDPDADDLPPLEIDEPAPEGKLAEDTHANAEVTTAGNPERPGDPDTSSADADKSSPQSNDSSDAGHDSGTT